MAQGKIFFLVGPELFLLREHLTEWRKSAEKKYGEFSVLRTSLDIPEKDADGYLNQKTKELASEVLTPSFFGEKRVIFIDNFPPTVKGRKLPENTPKYLTRLIRSLEKLPSENVIIFSSENPDKRLKIYKELEKITELKTFEKMEDKKLHQWILARVATYGGKMLPAASSFLAEFCANDLWKIDQEIRKLVNHNEDKAISENDIQKLCIASTEVADFALSNALQEGKIRKIIQVFHTEMETGGVPQAVLLRDIAPVVRQILQVLWAISKGQNAKDIGMNPWLFGKWQKVAHRFSYPKIQEAYRALLLVDEGTKNGKIEISGNDFRLFNLVIETFFLEFFGERK